MDHVERKLGAQIWCHKAGTARADEGSSMWMHI